MTLLILSLGLEFLHDGSVAMITLPMPWYIPRNNAGLGFPVAWFVYRRA
jgi:hypothetical protein